MADHAADAWPRAFTAIAEATGAEPDAVGAFLDSRHGRHFDDDVIDGLGADATLDAAINAATARWMAWRIRRRISRETGIPAELPFLTGFLFDAVITIEAVA